MTAEETKRVWLICAYGRTNQGQQVHLSLVLTVFPLMLRTRSLLTRPLTRTWRELQQTFSSGLEMGEEWQTRLQSRVRWPRTHPDELWSGAEHFEAALMTSCGTLPGLLSARRDRERETPETGCDGQTEYFGFFRPSRCEAGEMSYLRSGSSLHSQFLWPQNCTCLLTADPGGGKKQQPNTWEMKKTKGLIYEQWTVCLTDLLKAGN